MFNIKIENVFSKEEILILEKSILNSKKELDTTLGREITKNLYISKEIIEKLNNILKNNKYNNLNFSGAVYAHYNKEYGHPNLPPHLDQDGNDLIINFQLSSNTCWPIGLDKNLYLLEDNSAVIFNGNKTIHWRPIKNFENSDYVKMIFFRFFESNEKFKEIYEFRDIISKTINYSNFIPS